MKRNLIVHLLACLLVCSSMAGIVSAQFPYKSQGSVYTPSKSPLPIYLQYFRTDVGVTDPYNNFVRPREELRRTLQAQQTRINYLQAEQQTMLQNQRQGGVTSIAPTGSGSQYFNYLHYYPGLSNR